MIHGRMKLYANATKFNVLFLIEMRQLSLLSRATSSNDFIIIPFNCKKLFHLPVAMQTTRTFT